jgi:hypothetical protein
MTDPIPLPTHLRHCAVPLDEPVEEGCVRASVRCPCGETRFELGYPGQTHDWGGLEIPCVAQIGQRHFFVLTAHCVGCGRDHLLLDIDFHGWDGIACHDPEQAALPRPPLVPWACRDCAGLSHSGIVTISIESRDFILGEGGNDIDPERWYDAFGWFSLDLRCAQCGRDEPELISYEAA